MENSWKNTNVQGWKAFILKEKFKSLKLELKKWNNEVFGHVDTKIQFLEGETCELDSLAEEIGLSKEEVEKRRKKFSELRKVLFDKESLIKQKSRVKWLKEGDANTSFFHACLSIRRINNRMVAINVDGIWIEEAIKIKEEVTKYFTKIVAEENWQRPLLDGVPFPQLKEEEVGVISTPFAMDELELVISNLEGKKKSGTRWVQLQFL